MLKPIRTLLTILCLMTFTEVLADTDIPASLYLNEPPAFEHLSNKEIQSVYQGNDGDLWISTRSGLFQYDGYSLVCHKSDYSHPALLTSNNILCVAEDTRHRLWIGTYSGLNVLDLTTSSVRKIDNREMNGNTISDILVTRNGRLLLATDWGLYEYQEDADDFLCYSEQNTGGVLPKTSIKSLLEDREGNLWIGTWNEGLFRYNAETDTYYRYPKLNGQNSAHVLFQDSRDNLWIGTWRGGLVLLKDALHPDRVTYVNYRRKEGDASSIADDIIYTLAEDTNSGDLWIGTRKGISILPAATGYHGTEHFRNYYSGTDGQTTLPSDEVTSLLCDRQGLMWIGMIGGGMVKADVRRPFFGHDSLKDVRHLLHTSSVRSMLVDDEGLLWIGIGSSGFGVRNLKTGRFTHYTQMEEFTRQRGNITTIMSIMQRSSDGHIWLSAYDDGVYEIDKHAPQGTRVRHHTTGNAPWLPGDCVYQVMEDSHGNLWFATRNGVSMLSADGHYQRFDNLQANGTRLSRMVTVCLAEDAGGRIWCGSSTQGVYCLEPERNGSQPSYSLKSYNAGNGKLNVDEVCCLYAHGNRLWLGTGSCGLSVYDPATDSFRNVHKQWDLPGDAVVSIRHDDKGHLWLGTNAGLIRVIPEKDLERATFRLYTKNDGLQDNIFTRGASATGPDGELMFGGYLGYNRFFPDSLQDRKQNVTPFITDIRIHGVSWDKLQPDTRADISERSPRFTDKIRLDHNRNNFSIEFSAMEYINPMLTKYAYKLEGFDKEWQTTGASERRAYYNNLQSGTYTFRLKASDINGSWGDGERRLKITVLPPPWLTWWAYTLYFMAACAAGYAIYHMVRNKVRRRNTIHVREMEKAKVEEMNHVKLQFFTNITHELLTPLTILYASVGELKRTAPDFKEQYRLMYNNINRLIRLVQQLLEFKRNERGDLKLSVSQGDLALFIRRGIDSITPLVRRQDIHFSYNCHPEQLPAYFDQDKVDKILYNLLSNASKHDPTGGLVSIELRATDDGRAQLTVRDHGPGIPKNEQKDLFKRFYEGDYRRYTNAGDTGIALSLVRDLVKLHHGTVKVESEEGKGTTFTVMLPIRREDYTDEEVNEKTVSANGEFFPDESIPAENTDSPSKPKNENELHSLLLVENNGELLLLMTKLLQNNYKVYTASNEGEALDILERQRISLIVTDAMMPDTDGLTFCRMLKNKSTTKHIPVILLTANNSEEYRAQAYDSGVDAFIAKPFDISVLQSRIANLLQTRKRMELEKAKTLVVNVDNMEYIDSDKEFLEQFIKCVTEHMSNPEFSQPQLLKAMHMSRSTLARRIKQLTGQNYTIFVTNIRIRTACRIMEERKQISISEVANLVGYNDSHYFSTSFKKIIGMTPTEYQKKLKEP